MNGPNPNELFPLVGNKDLQFIKNSLNRSNVTIGEYSYYSAKAGESFADCIQHHYEFLGDQLIIGKFNSFGSGLAIIMNGANHRMTGSTYPFNIFGKGWETVTPSLDELPLKGDTMIGNDIWIGMNVTIMPGIRIGNGAIVAASSVVTKDVPGYTIVGGNPATLIKQRFSDEEIKGWESLAWWNWPIEEITEHLGLLAHGDLLSLMKVKPFSG